MDVNVTLSWAMNIIHFEYKVLEAKNGNPLIAFS